MSNKVYVLTICSVLGPPKKTYTLNRPPTLLPSLPWLWGLCGLRRAHSNGARNHDRSSVSPISGFQLRSAEDLGEFLHFDQFITCWVPPSSLVWVPQIGERLDPIFTSTTLSGTQQINPRPRRDPCDAARSAKIGESPLQLQDSHNDT